MAATVSAQQASPFAGPMDYSSCGAGVLNECGEEGDTQCNYEFRFGIDVDSRRLEVGFERVCRNTGFSKRYKDRPQSPEPPRPGPTAGGSCVELSSVVNRFPGANCPPGKP
jgi:hypothetical protein